MALTPKQEKFCQSIVSGMNQSDAYRSSYSWEDMQPDTVNKNAYIMMQDNQILTRIEALRLPIAERVGRTLEQHIARLQELGFKAEGIDKLEAALKAEELTGKVLGYYVNKTELTGRNGTAIEHKITREIIDPSVDGTLKD